VAAAAALRCAIDKDFTRMSAMKLKWRHESKTGLWKSATSKYRYEIRKSERSGSVGYDIGRFVAGSTSGYARYIGGYHSYPTLEVAMAVVQSDADAVAAAWE
jgi:hypothetical protein